MVSPKKNVLFLQRDLDIGGIPLASISLFKELKDRFCLHLWLTKKEGMLRDKVPSEVNVSVLPKTRLTSTMRRLCSHGKYLGALKLCIAYIHAKTRLQRNKLVAETYLRQSDSFQNYDCVIAYHGMDIQCLLWALYAVHTPKRIAWIHGETHEKKLDLPIWEQLYAKFDKIYCVSEASRLHFIRKFPSCQNHAEVLLNFLDAEKIINLSNVPTDISFSPTNISIVTVGRVSEEKGQTMIPHIVKRLMADGIAFTWHIVGDGAALPQLKELIDTLGVEKNIILHGNQKNPYPFMKYCDLYIQPSYTEGYCLTLREASILGCRIIATDVGGNREVLESTPNSYLVAPTTEQLYKEIKKQLKSIRTHNNEGNGVADNDYSNRDELQKLIRFI